MTWLDDEVPIVTEVGVKVCYVARVDIVRFLLDLPSAGREAYWALGEEWLTDPADYEAGPREWRRPAGFLESLMTGMVTDLSGTTCGLDAAATEPDEAAATVLKRGGEFRGPWQFTCADFEVVRECVPWIAAGRPTWTATLDPQPGDLAWHMDGLDPRPVTRVEGGSIGLDVDGHEVWPCPRANYTFTGPGATRSPEVAS